MRDFRVTIVMETHSKRDVIDTELEMMVQGFKALLTGAGAEGYIKVVDVKVEALG